jgi:hypothetical protein
VPSTGIRTQIYSPVSSDAQVNSIGASLFVVCSTRMQVAGLGPLVAHQNPMDNITIIKLKLFVFTHVQVLMNCWKSNVIRLLLLSRCFPTMIFFTFSIALLRLSPFPVSRFHRLHPLSSPVPFHPPGLYLKACNEMQDSSIFLLISSVLFCILQFFHGDEKKGSSVLMSFFFSLSTLVQAFTLPKYFICDI